MNIYDRIVCSWWWRITQGKECYINNVGGGRNRRQSSERVREGSAISIFALLLSLKDPNSYVNSLNNDKISKRIDCQITPKLNWCRTYSGNCDEMRDPLLFMTHHFIQTCSHIMNLGLREMEIAASRTPLKRGARKRTKTAVPSCHVGDDHNTWN